MMSAHRIETWYARAAADTDPTCPLTVVIGGATDASPYRPSAGDLVATIDDPALGVRSIVDFRAPAGGPRGDDADYVAATLRALADAIVAGATR